MTLLTFTAADGARLAYRDETIGAGGRTILCLAGLTRNSTDFDYVLPHLTDARVIRPDYRGAAGRPGPGPRPIPWRRRRAMRWRCWTIWGWRGRASLAPRAAG